MTTYLEKNVPGDLVVHMESLEYCTKTAQIRNTTGSTVTLGAGSIAGQPVKAGTGTADYNLAKAGDEASVIGLILDGPTGQDDQEVILNNGYSVYKWQVLVHPPVVINQTYLPALDVLAAAFTVASIVTALKALGWEFRTEPAKTTTL